jgi:hypothetical protein
VCEPSKIHVACIDVLNKGTRLCPSVTAGLASTVIGSDDRGKASTQALDRPNTTVRIRRNKIASRLLALLRIMVVTSKAAHRQRNTSPGRSGKWWLSDGHRRRFPRLPMCVLRRVLRQPDSTRKRCDARPGSPEPRSWSTIAPTRIMKACSKSRSVRVHVKGTPVQRWLSGLYVRERQNKY